MKRAIANTPLILMTPAVALLLVACQQQEPPSTPGEVSQEAATVETAAVETATVETAAVETATVDTASGPASPEPQSQAPAEPLEEMAQSEPEPVNLNLSIPRDILEETADTGFPSRQRVALPDLFAKKEKSGTKVSSKLHFEEGETAAMDNISGAEITVKVPLD